MFFFLHLLGRFNPDAHLRWPKAAAAKRPTCLSWLPMAAALDGVRTSFR
ncbi:hypothetical protein O9929_27935 [Vibrio lentus]|nr:hypothetical protein [Vibrio lentus]